VDQFKVFSFSIHVRPANSGHLAGETGQLWGGNLFIFSADMGCQMGVIPLFVVTTIDLRSRANRDHRSREIIERKIDFSEQKGL
jgi:cephalosporin hydroxylase